MSTSPSAPPIIRLAGVRKSYIEGARRHVVFDGVELEVASGELVVLLGRSGSGKSTLLNLLCGLDAADSGRIEVAGHTVSALAEPALTLFRRHSIGVVFQSYNLIPTLTARENIVLPLALTRGREHFEAGEQRLLEALGIADRIDAYPERLSGGEQQRVAIARALVHRPRVLLADEPTGNLDLETGRTVLALLDAAVRDTGCTLIMATHSREVMGLADRVLAIEQGRIIRAT